MAGWLRTVGIEVTGQTVRRWVREERLLPVTRDLRGRALYRLGDALTAYAERPRKQIVAKERYKSVDVFYWVAAGLHEAWRWLRAVQDWGSVPAWVALLVAGLVATPAFRSARYTRRQVDVLLDDRKREAYERKSMQASQFAVWLDMDAPGELVLHGMNSSSLPIFDATSRIVGEEGIVYETNNPVVRPHPTPIVLKHLNALSRETQLEIVKVMRDDAAVAVDVTFRDNANVSWRRHRGGLLVEIDRQANPSGEATTDEPPS